MIWDKRFRGLGAKFIFGWFIIDVILALILWFSLNVFTFTIYFTLWLLIIRIASALNLKSMVPSSIMLAVLEETIVFFLGGGLGGEARSLVDDYLGSIPMFAGLIIGWWLFIRKHKVDPNYILILSGLQGFIIELVFTGLILNPLNILFFGGATLFIYSSIICTPNWPQGMEDTNVVSHIKWFIISFILGLIGGILGAVMRSIYNPSGLIL